MCTVDKPLEDRWNRIAEMVLPDTYLSSLPGDSKRFEENADRCCHGHITRVNSIRDRSTRRRKNLSIVISRSGNRGKIDTSCSHGCKRWTDRPSLPRRVSGSRGADPTQKTGWDHRHWSASASRSRIECGFTSNPRCLGADGPSPSLSRVPGRIGGTKFSFSIRVMGHDSFE